MAVGLVDHFEWLGNLVGKMLVEGQGYLWWSSVCFAFFVSGYSGSGRFVTYS